MSDLSRTVEALLFLSSEPLGTAAIAEATEVVSEDVEQALSELEERYAQQQGGLVLKRVGGGFLLATDPIAEAAAKRLFSKPRTAPLSQAQAETLAVIAYLQPVSRPEIARIRGVNTDSASGALLERGLIEEAGRSQFGATLYRTSDLFLKLFGLDSLKELPEISQWDPAPEEAAELRDRLLKAGSARLGGTPQQELASQESPGGLDELDTREAEAPGGEATEREEIEDAGSVEPVASQEPVESDSAQRLAGESSAVEEIEPAQPASEQL